MYFLALPNWNLRWTGLLRDVVWSGLVMVLQSHHIPGFSAPSVSCLTSLPDFRVLWPLSADTCSSSSGKMSVGSYSCFPWECLGVYFHPGQASTHDRPVYRSSRYLSNWVCAGNLRFSIVKFSSGISYSPVAKIFPRNLLFLQ